MFDGQGALRGTGYAGKDWAKNMPACESVHNMGPIPEGLYFVGKPFDHPKCGKFFLPLTPDPGNRMFDRSGFGCHGDKIESPGDASDGCIIQALNVREQLSASGDLLQVISGWPSPTDPSASPHV